MPDWLGTHAVEYVLGEAKDSYKGSAKSWLTMTPPHKCVEASLEQINNCQLVDSTGTVITSDRWAVANLWATDENKRPPVMIAWDPPGDGHKFPRISGRSMKGNALTVSRLHVAGFWAVGSHPATKWRG